MNKKIVAGAIIVENGRIFIACRPEGKTLAHQWEFPGGKQEPGETLPDCLRRELKEELNINAVIGEPFMVSTFEYDFAVIELHTFFVTVEVPDDIKSNEHEKTAWVLPCELKNYTFAPADVPVIEKLAALKL